MAAVSLEQLTFFLDTSLEVARFARRENNGILRPSDQPVRHLGLALEPFEELYPLVGTLNLDALFLHRPWRVALSRLPPQLGLLSYHLPFDEKLTLGYNLRLAKLLDLGSVIAFGEKEGRPLGMIGSLSSPTDLTPALSTLFGGLECVETKDDVLHRRVAIVGAMTPDLVSRAAAQGASAYITGAWRERARHAVETNGLGVWVVGHERSESWGLGLLKSLLHHQFAGLEITLLRP